MASKKYNLSDLKINRLTWRKVLEDALNPENREVFINRKNSVDMYIDGVKLTTIEDETKIKKQRYSILLKNAVRLIQLRTSLMDMQH